MTPRPGADGGPGGEARHLAGDTVWLTALVLVAANLRPVIASVPPVVDQVAAALALSPAAAGVLTTLPVVCMGLFAPAAAVTAARHGERRVLVAAVACICLGAGGRAMAGTVGLYAGTTLAGVGIAVAGAVLPALVRSRAPARVGPVTGLYTAFLIGGALLAAGGTEPLRAVLGVSAQAVLAVWAVPAAAAVAVWLLVPGLAPTSSTVDIPRPRLPWRSRAAWLATLFMGAQSLLFYATLAWLAVRYIDLGVTAGAASGLLAIFSATQIVTALAMPALSHRDGAPARWIAISVLSTTAGLLGVGAWPMAAPWLWASLLGLGMGGNVALALTVLTQAAPDPRAATAYTGMAFLVGYLLASVGPVAAGALLDATGSLTAVFLVLAGLGVVTLGLGLRAAHPSRRRAEHPAAEPSPTRP